MLKASLIVLILGGSMTQVALPAAILTVVSVTSMETVYLAMNHRQGAWEAVMTFSVLNAVGQLSAVLAALLPGRP